MEFHIIKNITDPSFALFWSLYETSFPSDECRNLSQQKKILNKKEYALFAFFDNENFIGFLSTWDLGDFVFIEHFAVVENLRGNGFGTEILALFLSMQKQHRKEIVLETEPPQANFSAKRRAAFYERMGFKICLEKYIQPAYHLNKKPVPLYLMRFEKDISKEEFIFIRKKLYEVVYKVKSQFVK